MGGKTPVLPTIVGWRKEEGEEGRLAYVSAERLLFPVRPTVRPGSPTFSSSLLEGAQQCPTSWHRCCGQRDLSKSTWAPSSTRWAPKRS